MAVPKRKKTSSRRDQRRMHLFLKSPAITPCPKCKKPVRSHTVCYNCGYYGGKQVIDVLADLTKKEKKLREKEIKAAENQGASEKPMTMEGLSQK
jgi:large subunit ribosomal protein L32